MASQKHLDPPLQELIPDWCMDAHDLSILDRCLTILIHIGSIMDQLFYGITRFPLPPFSLYDPYISQTDLFVDCSYEGYTNNADKRRGEINDRD